MAKEKNLVEDALIQMKNLEEAVAENAKGILASTMKQEIKELVKESIVSEQGDDDDEIETDDEMDMDMDMDSDDEMGMDMDSDDDDEMEVDMDSDDEMDMDMDMDSDMSDIGMSDDVIDLSDTKISDEDLLKVFLSMDEEDGIIVKKDNNMVNLKDDNTDKEYMIQMESAEGDEFMDMDMGESYEDDEMDMDMDDEDDDDMDIDSDDETYMNMDDEDYSMEMGEGNMNINDIIDSVFGNGSKPSYGKDEEEEEEEEEVVYEIEMDHDDMTEEEDFQMESTKPKIGTGAKIGKPKFSYKKTSGGFKDDMKQGTRGVGMGKPKFEFKEGMKKEKMEGSKLMGKGKPSSMFYSGKKEETKEASRTYGFGSEKGRGLRKGITPNRNLTFENEQKNVQQIQILREKNEEYRKALNVFRDKLNEVAVFNSNLAYATRLFTEHSTSKQEKINILRRFDDAETIKESKNLYRTIKSELTTTNKTSITESIEGKIEKTPSSGSASTLIESKTYENPQFLRMKDIMSKIIK
jgi:hypothetical protein